MAPPENDSERTQEEKDNEARARWDLLFAEEKKRQRALARVVIPTNRDDDSDEESDTPAPKYDQCLRVQGPTRVPLMCNFSPVEFEHLWETVKGHVLANWNVGRGKKCQQSPKDLLLMLLAALKHCGSWDTVSAMFDIDTSPFQKMIKKFLVMIEPFLYENFVLNEEKYWTMQQLTASGNTFTNYPSARYATGVTFQHADRPSGKEAKKYIIGKHNLHGYKVEVSVLPTGAAINCTDFEPGSVADVDMFQYNASFHRSAMQKLQDESVLHDNGPMTDPFQDHWGVLVDRGYQSLAGAFRVIQPKKKTHGVPLNLKEKLENERMDQDRVIVEYFFGRLRTLWGICSNKWTWDRKSYNLYFRVCVALTNFSVQCRPLRHEDGDNYLRYEAQLKQFGADTAATLKRKRQGYSESRRARLKLQQTRMSPSQTPIDNIVNGSP